MLIYFRRTEGIQKRRASCKALLSPFYSFLSSVDCSVSLLHNYGSEDQNKFLTFHTNVLAAVGDHSIPLWASCLEIVRRMSNFILPFLDLKKKKKKLKKKSF